MWRICHFQSECISGPSGVWWRHQLEGHRTMSACGKMAGVMREFPESSDVSPPRQDVQATRRANRWRPVKLLFSAFHQKTKKKRWLSWRNVESFEDGYEFQSWSPKLGNGSRNCYLYTFYSSDPWEKVVPVHRPLIQFICTDDTKRIPFCLQLLRTQRGLCGGE